jgi:serine O-acetyltransferase
VDSTFLQQISDRQQFNQEMPTNQSIYAWASELLDLLFPERISASSVNMRQLAANFEAKKTELISLLKATKACNSNCCEKDATVFFDTLPNLYRKLNCDVQAIIDGDPAACDRFEVIRCYPGFLAISVYRLAHELYKLKIPYIPRILTETAHSLTGIDIHPAAEIGEHLFIDHGTGIVIGETTRIGNHVKLYQGVTLGALSVEKALANSKRHPTIGNHVIIYAGATILGGNTTVGDHSIIGGSVWLTKSVPAKTIIYHQPSIRITENENTL